MQVRMTQASAARNAMTGLQGNLSRLGKLQEQLSSGKLITRPSDSPTGTVAAMQVRAEMRTTEQYLRNADDGLSWLSVTDGALTNTTTQLRRVRDLTLQGLSAGTAGSQAAREALAVEIDNIRADLFGLANARYLDRPVFGGTSLETNAYDPQTGAIQANEEPVLRTIGDGVRVRVDTSALKTFGDGPEGAFEVLSEISRKLREAPSELSASLGQLDVVMDDVLGQMADVGARTNRLEQMRNTANERILTLKTQLSEAEDIDLPNTIMELQLQQTAYQAALAATAKVIQPSLVDFLR